MESNIPWSSIVKNIKGQLTTQEQQSLDNWLKEDDNNLKILSEIQNIYSLTSYIPPYFYPDREEAWKNINSKINIYKRNRKLVVSWFKYVAAAIAVLLIGYSSLIIYHNIKIENSQYYSEIIAPPGQKTLVLLPDSSSVWLNSGSTLKYGVDFNVNNRNVVLDGEAFFDVKKDKTKKFVVQTGTLFVHVYGTSFNVKNYSDEYLQEITVKEGRVGVYDKNKALKQLTPGQQVLLNKSTKKLTSSNADPDIVSSWKDNELKFDNTPFATVVKYLERWYGVNINFDPTMNGKHNYTFKIKTESLTELLEKIKLMTPIAYEVNGKDVKIRYVK